MQKETLTPDVVRKDLQKMIHMRETHVAENRYTCIFIGLLAAGAVGFLTRSLWIGLVASPFAIYHIVKLFQELRANHALFKEILYAVRHGELVVSTEILEHVSEELFYRQYRHQTVMYTVRHLCFRSGRRWQMPDTRHYEWSMQYCMSSQGLDHTSVSGNEFYIITLQGHYEIAYAYNKSLFALDFPEHAER